MAFPNEAQLQIIRHRGRPLVALAGPGTGKTATLVERVMVLLEEDPAAPIAFITFTRMSRRDTARKLEERFGRAAVVQRDDAEIPRVATLHTFAKSIVHRGAHHLGLEATFSVVVPGREDFLIFEEACEDAGVELEVTAVRRYVEGCRYMDGRVETAEVSREVSERLDPRIEGALRFYNAVDLAGLVNAARVVIEREPDLLTRTLLHLDEYQDLNPADQRLVHALIRGEGREIVVVGDDDQSIYGGRRADPSGIRELMGDEGWERVILRECHRLPAHILRASQRLLRLQRRPGLDKQLVEPKEDGLRVPVYQCTTADVENRRIVADVGARVERSQGTERPYKFSDFMVLSPYRRGLGALATLLTDAGIPIRVKTRKVVPDELWDLLLVLRMVRGDDQLAVRQWLPKLGVGAEEIGRLRHEAGAAGRRLFEHLRMVGPAAVRDFFGTLDELRARGADALALLGIIAEQGVTAVPADVLGAVRAGLDDAEEQEAISVPRLVRTLYEEYGLLEAEEDSGEEDKVLLSTLHSAKGLEARVVYIVHLDDRFMPAVNRDHDEEVRVLYVGMTRAKEALELSFAERFDVVTRRRLGREAGSPFLRGIDECVEVIRVTAGDL